MPVFYCRILNLGKWQSEAIAGVHSLENLKTGQGNGMRLEKQTVLSAAWFSQILGSWIFYMVDEVSHLIGKRSVQFSSVQLLSCVWLFATPWTAARQASLSITNTWSLPKLMSIESVMPSKHLILCCPLLLLRPIPPSIRVFSNESALLMRWPKYWSFSFSISPSNEHSGLISLRMDWLDLLAVQRTLKSVLCGCTRFFVNILWHY